MSPLRGPPIGLFSEMNDGSNMIASSGLQAVPLMNAIQAWAALEPNMSYCILLSLPRNVRRLDRRTDPIEGFFSGLRAVFAILFTSLLQLVVTASALVSAALQGGSP